MVDKGCLRVNVDTRGDDGMKKEASGVEIQEEVTWRELFEQQAPVGGRVVHPLCLRFPLH